MFSEDFFPAPPEVIDIMLPPDLQGRNVWEPEAGKCDIVKRCQEAGANVYACENNPDLLKIVQSTCTVIAPDMLTVTSEQVSHIDYVIMNPPFSQQEKHILHAYNVMPAGCKLTTLCNINALKNPYSKSREELVTLVNMFGSYVDLGEAFKESERRTLVNVALVRIQKPANNYETEFEGFFMDEEPEEQTGPGLMPYNVIRDLVNRYVEAVKVFDAQLETAVRLQDLTGSFFKANIGFTVTSDQKPVTRNDFKKDLQKSGWQYIFSKLNMQKYATKGLKEDINKFVETQTHIPFTMANIYKMLELVIGTNGSRMDRAILEVFERVTKHHADNRYNVEGWKTNSHYLLTRRFIIPRVVQIGWSGQVDSSYSSDNFQMIEDLVKALCFITGENYDEKISLYDFINNPFLLKRDGKYIHKKYDDFTVVVKERTRESIGQEQQRYPGSEIEHNEIEWGKWIEWGFFRFRAYKKGTCHLEFKDENVWAQFNQRVAKLKGYPLQEKKQHTAYQERQHGRKSEPKQTSKQAPKKATIISTIKI